MAPAYVLKRGLANTHRGTHGRDSRSIFRRENYNMENGKIEASPLVSQMFAKLAATAGENQLEAIRTAVRVYGQRVVADLTRIADKTQVDANSLSSTTEQRDANFRAWQQAKQTIAKLKAEVAAL